jgi:hypothetical protein
MKCPHCGKKVDVDPNSAQALLVHITDNLRKAKDWVSRLDSIHGKEWLGRDKKAKTVVKWQSWHDWVEAHLEES